MKRKQSTVDFGCFPQRNLITKPYQNHVAGDDGWCEETQPVMNGYKMACCDCGLVHEVEFKAIRLTAQHPDGTWSYVEMKPEKYRVSLRMRRLNRATAAVRRESRKRLVAQYNQDEIASVPVEIDRTL